MMQSFGHLWRPGKRRAKFNWRVDLRKFKDAAKYQPKFLIA